MHKENKKLLLVCSSGGHFRELHLLDNFWKKYERVWVTFDKQDTQGSLNDEKCYYAFHPTNRNIKNLIRNFFLAIKILRNEKPDVIVSTGAGVAIPFFYLGKVFGSKTVYIESIARINSASLTGKVIAPVCDLVVVQWKETQKFFKKAVYGGTVV